MSTRALGALICLAALTSASCPRVEEATPDPAAVVVATSTAVHTGAAPAPAVEAVAGAEPPVAPDLPPDLVDDGSDDVPDLEPAPKPVDTGPKLASVARETWVYAEPRWSARRIGYLRAGAVVARREQPIHHGNCLEGWYRVEPRGYVCVNFAATLSIDDPIVKLAHEAPRRDDLPYLYVMSRFPPPPLYARFPSQSELLDTEPDLPGHMKEAARWARDLSFVAPPPADDLPPLLESKRALPALQPGKRGAATLSLGHAKARSGFALLHTYDHDGRRYGLTTDLALIPIDRTRVIKPSAFHGIQLDDSTTLPVAFEKRHHGARWNKASTGGVTRGAELAFREAVPVTSNRRRVGGVEYVEAKDGSYLPVDEVVVVEPLKNPPVWSQSGRKWIDVSILHQSLVAYEGKRPVYVTLVSTGADGLGDPKTTHSTIQGAFLIHTKHISVTMDDDKIGDEFDFRDVPFVQYFTEGFALHAAYWHDDFGTPRSHGCVNLAPIDAAWLFGWTDPHVPEGWHGALSLKKGTLVFVRP